MTTSASNHRDTAAKWYGGRTVWISVGAIVRNDDLSLVAEVWAVSSVGILPSQPRNRPANYARRPLEPRLESLWAVAGGM